MGGETKMKSYDVIIAGGGAAGLSLAYHLVHSPLRDRSILIVEKDAKDQNDHTWSFWTDQPTLFDDIVSRSWSKLQVLGEQFGKTFDLHTYRYKMIRGIDFYCFARQALSVCPHVEFLQGKVEMIEDGDQEASVLVDGQKYTGTWVFDSRFNRATFKPDEAHYHYLKQQFKGWEIETLDKAFNPQVATFLDFRAPQEKGMHFFYVLPFSERNALVESVLCTTIPVSWEDCEQALRIYLATVLDIKEYSIEREERGISPLTDWPFPRHAGRRIMTIGTLGGRIKPSTGYAFLRMQEDSSAIVRSLVKMGHPFSVSARPRRYRFFDSVMLEIMTHHGERIGPIFTALFKRNPAERIFRFLDEVASLWENCLMIPSLPPQLLLQALLRLDAVRRV
jgi:lycopene beta-cyclase